MYSFKTTLMLSFCILWGATAAPCQSSSSDTPMIIRDTDIADGVEHIEPPKERDPSEAKRNIEIGNFYFNKKNYVGAIGRYLVALEYQADSEQAMKEFARAYKSLVKAIDALPVDSHDAGDMIYQTIGYLEDYLRSNPDSEKHDYFQKIESELKEKVSQQNN